MSNKTKPFVAKSSSSSSTQQSQAPAVPITTTSAAAAPGDPAPAAVAGNSSSVVPPRYQPPPLPPSGSSQGILKHHLIAAAAPPKDHASGGINKQHQHHHQYHPQQKLPDQVKIPYPGAAGVDPAGNPVAAGKYYPVSTHQLPPAPPQAPTSGKQYPFPAYPLPGQQHHHLVNRHQQQQQHQQQPHHQQIGDDRTTTTQVQIHHPHHQQQQQQQQLPQPQHHQQTLQQQHHQQQQQHQRPLLDEPGIPQIHPDLRLPPQHRQPLRYDDEFLRPEMLKFVRKPEDTAARMPSSAAAAAGVVDPNNRHVQNILQELRSLKEANQRLADDNQELRDLCCFLDDDRQKGRKLAREWQRFGRYTASVMRQEVSAYQNKLRELDNKQQELIKDNLELKELCLYLDEERGGGGSSSNPNAICPACGIILTAQTSNGIIMRDDGDGSSSSTNADEPGVPTSSSSHHHQQQQQQQQFATTGTITTGPIAASGTAGNGVSAGVGVNNAGTVMAGTNVNNVPRRSASRERILHENLARQRSTFNDQIMQYVRSLEQRVKQLEEDKRALTHKINQMANNSANTTTISNDSNNTVINTLTNNCDSTNGMVLSGRPEAVVRALQVLEVREQLEREGRMPPPLLQQPQSVLGAPERANGNPGATAAGGENSSDSTTSQDMDDGEKALVREMCNVVWRKLEEGPASRR